MRTGGFPCRISGCPQCFAVADQRSMVALQAASTARAEHELAAHGYRHVALGDGTPARPWSSRAVPRKR